ncbi:MAG TPA: extracellular solute-binding protein, partial [Gemmatimonadaceae bacterium]|nr:extracellular solute-binding protein [Gemmatimonadaceae bacterium]
LLLAALSLSLLACATSRDAAREPVVVAAAGSLAAPLRVALDSFTARTGTRVEMHTAGSVELARRVIELEDVPDVLAVADEEVFPALLRPEHVGWWGVFARNRLVLAVAPKARYAAEIDSTNWWRVAAREGVEVGRSDPALDPAGYRALMALRLGAKAYGDSGIERAVLARSPARDVRPKSADLVALLETGALDYAFVYESSARTAGLRFIPLGARVDLGDDSRAGEYREVTVSIPGKTRGSTVEVHATPIRYALSVPTAAAHFVGGMALANYLLSEDGRRVLQRAGLDTVPPRIEGAAAKRVADSLARVKARP